MNSECEGTALGCDFNGRDGYLAAGRTKHLQLFHDVLVLLSRAGAAPSEVMKLMGSLQWFDLLNRGKLAVYDSIYAFELLPDPDTPHVNLWHAKYGSKQF